MADSDKTSWPSIGQRVAQYEILEKIGRGGMGEVYLAQDTSLDRRVALKFLPEEVEGDPTEKKRFLRGAKSAAALDHPFICNIYGVGEVEERSFIAMEYVRGETLAQRLGQKSLPLREALRVASEIAEALEAAHLDHIVHRDLKPSNIMLTAGNHVKVLDFGLAKRVKPLGDSDSQYETASRLTARGSTLGTLAYMSPEQVRGQALDPRSDIFAFGLVLYEMLAGVHPFLKETPIETAASILNLDPPPLSRYCEAPPLLEHIVRKMLAKDPSARYQLVHEVRTDLGHVGDASEKPRAPEPEALPPRETRSGGRRTTGEALRRPLTGRIPLRRFTRWARRRWKYAFLGGAAALLVLAAALGVWRWSASPSPPARDLSVAVLPLRNTSADPRESEYLAEGLSQAVSRKLAQAGVRVSPWDTARRYKGTDKPADRVARELNVDAVLAGDFQLMDEKILLTLSMMGGESGLVFWEDELEGPFEDLFRLESQIARGAAARLKKELGDEEKRALAPSESESLDAYDVYLQGAHILQEGTAEAIPVAFRYFSRAVELDPALAEAHIGLGTVHAFRYFNTWEGGLENLGNAESSFERALQLSPSSLRARRGLVQVSWERGLAEACLIQGQEAARLGRSDDIETLLARADAYHLGGLRERALPLYRRVIELDPMNEAAHWQLVAASALAGELEETLRVGDRYIRRFGPDIEVHTYVAVAHQLLGDEARAQEYYQKAIDLGAEASSGQGVLPPNSVAAAFLYAGLFHDQQGNRARAEELWRRGVRLLEPKLEEYPQQSKMRLYLACFHGLLGEEDAFLAEEARAFEASNLNTFELLHLATVHAKTGGTERAAELLRLALRQGRVDSFWRVLFQLATVSLAQPELEEFRLELEQEEKRLGQRY